MHRVRGRAHAGMKQGRVHAGAVRCWVQAGRRAVQGLVQCSAVLLAVQCRARAAVQRCAVQCKAGGSAVQRCVVAACSRESLQLRQRLARERAVGKHAKALRLAVGNGTAGACTGVRCAVVQQQRVPQRCCAPGWLVVIVGWFTAGSRSCVHGWCAAGGVHVGGGGGVGCKECGGWRQVVAWF